MTPTDILSNVIEQATEKGVRKALDISEVTNSRLFSVAKAATYLDASESEVRNMIARRELPVVEHGRRTKLDVRDLDAWIEKSKKVL